MPFDTPNSSHGQTKWGPKSAREHEPLRELLTPEFPRLRSCFAKHFQSEVMVKQGGSEITLESLDHLLVPRQIQGTTEFDQLRCLLRLLGIHVNISPVHVDNTFCHVQVCLVRFVRVARTCHEIALSKIFCEQGPVHPAEFLLRDACLLVVRQSAEQEFHVKIWPHALHLLNNLRYIRKFEALEGTLGVIDAREHGKKTDTEVVPENDLHHVWLVVMTLR